MTATLRFASPCAHARPVAARRLARLALIGTALVGSAVAAPLAAAADAPPPVPAGSYRIDPTHATLVFSVDHLGFSHYTASFGRFSAELEFDPAKRAATRLTATIDPRSLTLPSPPEGFLAQLLGASWLDADRYPEIRFRTLSATAVGARGLRIAGELTLHGVTRPVLLEGTYNGGYAGHPMDPHARIGFSAQGTLKRSEFGITYGIPAPGTTMGVGDAVQFRIEAEFTGPPLPGAPCRQSESGSPGCQPSRSGS